LSYIDDEVRGTDGPIQASFPDEERDPLPAAWVDTLGALGYPTSGDPFSGEMFGGYINATSVDPRSRIRSYAANAYLQPVRDRPNLHVETDVTVEKIIFDSTGDVPKAVGVKVRQSDGSIAILEAAKEIILAAGAIGSPKLLELSGIGQRQRLEELGIAIVFDNPNVGENLQDHPVVALSFEAADGVKTLDALHRQEPEAIGAAMKAYAANKTGPFALGGNITGSLLPVADFVTGSNAETSLKEILDATADANIDPTSPFSARHGSFVRSLLSKPNEGAGNIFMWAGLSNSQSEAEETTGANPVNNVGNAGDRFISICAALLFPLSRGSVHITSNNPADIPAVDPRYMEHPLDIEVLARLLRYIDTIRQTEPLSLYLKEEGRRNNGAPSDLQDLDQVKEFIRKTARTCWHPTSTCAMLPLESGGVVDPKLRVHGVAGLRVVDSSVMPIATRGNPQTTVYAVAERAADLIRETHGKQV
jgi:choline dehydrogenase-like flavoprotein